MVVHDEDTASLRKILGRHSAAAGGSSPVGWPQLQVGLAEALRAAERATSDRDFVQFDELAAEGMLGLLEAAGGAAVARRILLPLISRPAAERETLINAVTVWLSHNGAWDPSARELAVHRHTLRHRVAVVERLLEPRPEPIRRPRRAVGRAATGASIDRHLHLILEREAC